MRGELRRHKRSDAVKWVIVFAAIIVLGVAVAAAITDGFTEWNPYGWFDSVKEGGETAARALFKA